MAQEPIRDGQWWFRELSADEAVQPGETEFRYCRKHVPTGKEWIVRFACYSRLDFMELLAAWNRRGDGVWVYFEAW